MTMPKPCRSMAGPGYGPTSPHRHIAAPVALSRQHEDHWVADLFDLPVSWSCRDSDLKYECNTIQILRDPSQLSCRYEPSRIWLAPRGNPAVLSQPECGEQLDFLSLALIGMRSRASCVLV
ncbi:hypothetical protein [Propionivibrio sp.]|uniref:hypothetical protein n=1 Tax=Propionivibrio sp. TaxID=2212460 RepID=UPI0025D22CBA|nr:hypothetical protein [Propionivibrio sp.]MBK7357155.1 hypothetical protein [Propionivibrio sp.]